MPGDGSIFPTRCLTVISKHKNDRNNNDRQRRFQYHHGNIYTNTPQGEKSLCGCLSLNYNLIFSCASVFRAQNRNEVEQAPESIKCITESAEL